MGEKKQKFTEEGTNILSLRNAKKLIKKVSFVDTMSNYNPRGSKASVQVKSYAKWERMARNMQNLDASTVSNYNFYLALILRYLQLVAKIRIADRERRVETMK